MWGIISCDGSFLDTVLYLDALEVPPHLSQNCRHDTTKVLKPCASWSPVLRMMWHGSIDVALFVGPSTEMWQAKKLTFYQNGWGKDVEGGEAGVDGDDNFRADTAFNAFTALFSVSWEKCLRHRIFRCDGLLKAGNWTNHKLFIQLPFCILHIVFI